MKLVQLAAFVAFSVLGAAQLQNLPDCAKPCANSLPANCNLDVKCICADQAWITGISCCIKNSCPPAQQQQTLQVAVQLCDTVQVTLPSAASCPASAAPSGTSSVAAAGQGTTSSAAMMASSAASGGQNTASSAVSNGGTTATSATGSRSETHTSSTATSSTSAQAATGAAAPGFGSNIGAVGAAVAALALL